ncbi:hypothetical protein EKE94_01050 [Mesobaculum littorinae]|uniref:Uncharacterized protein n=1 Tax=Mesobaculum littorinae TaxID=2486419 RepID=A0A438AL30_9RHOB|nr:hypothetical protein [Mesobaculum littorinae]RVV99315.1 hypothetical protein EKE94_01050 [Mesobaculum littorinae]
MDILIWIGVVLTLLGIAGLGLCVVKGVSLRRAGLSDADLRARLQRLVALNLGALAVSALGLIAVITGILLG